MSTVFTITNAKGGCGKTTVSLNLAICFARIGYRTLAIDLDQQGNLSAGLGVDLNRLNMTAHRLLINEVPEIDKYLVEVRPQLKLLPNSIDIEADDLLEAKKVNRELLLRRQLKPIQSEHDVILIDTPPAMRAATVNALVVADSVIVPIDSSSFALLGMTQLVKTIAAISETHNPNLKIHVLTTMFNKRQNLDRVIRQQVEEFFGQSLVLESIIHRYVGVAEATAMKKGVVENTAATPPHSISRSSSMNSKKKWIMNKRDMQQLKASITRDLVQGQGDNSATRDLLKQYVPLNGIVSKPEPDIRQEMPVENCLAPHATVAQNDISAWRGATNKDDDDIKYFVKEITAQPDPRNRAWQKKRLERIVHKIRDISVSRANYSIVDFVEDVKCGCAREDIAFDNDAFDELIR